MKLKLLGCLILALAISGCDAYKGVYEEAPEDNRARLVIKNAEPDASLLINGETVGRAADFDDNESGFRLTQGAYTVEVWLVKDRLLTTSVNATDGSVETITVPKVADEETAAPK